MANVQGDSAQRRWLAHVIEEGLYFIGIVDVERFDEMLGNAEMLQMLRRWLCSNFCPRDAALYVADHEAADHEAATAMLLALSRAQLEAAALRIELAASKRDVASLDESLQAMVDVDTAEAVVAEALLIGEQLVAKEVATRQAAEALAQVSTEVAGRQLLTVKELTQDLEAAKELGLRELKAQAALHAAEEALADALAAQESWPQLQAQTSDAVTQTDPPNQLDSDEEPEPDESSESTSDFRPDTPPPVFLEAHYDSNGNMLGKW